MKNVIYFVLVCLLLVGCGRYSPPIPPEELSPQAIGALTVMADISSVKFTWDAPEKDRRGKELKFIDGYIIYRKTITKPSDMTDPDVEFENIGELEDIHIIERERLREEARAAKTPISRIKVDKTLTKFAFDDTNVEPGKTYVYKIVGFNQGSVEGEFLKYIRVLFRGNSSEIVLLDQAGNRENINNIVTEELPEDSTLFPMS